MEEKPPPKRGAGGKAPSVGCFCAYLAGCQGISAPFILPTKGPPSLLGGYYIGKNNFQN